MLRTERYSSEAAYNRYLWFAQLQADIYRVRRSGREDPHCHKSRTVPFIYRGDLWERTCFCCQCVAIMPFTCGHASCIPQQFEAQQEWIWGHSSAEATVLVRSQDDGPTDISKDTA